MADEIDWQGPVPAYQQLAAILRGRIASGEIEVGRAIPSNRDLMQQFGVGEHTAHRAVRLLKDEGIVRTTQGLGNFVIGKPGE